MTAALPTLCTSLILCKITRASALCLLKPKCALLGDVALREGLLEGLEQAYGEADVWLGLSASQVSALSVGLCLTIGPANQEPELLELYAVLNEALKTLPAQSVHQA